MTRKIDAVIAIAMFALASAELYYALSGKSSNPALVLSASMFLFGMGIIQAGFIAGGKD